MTYHLDQRNNHGRIDQHFYINLRPWYEYYTLEIHVCLYSAAIILGFVFQTIAFNQPLSLFIVRIFATVIAMLGMYTICKSSKPLAKYMYETIAHITEKHVVVSKKYKKNT